MLILFATLLVIQNKSLLNQACVTEHKTDKRIMSRVMDATATRAFKSFRQPGFMTYDFCVFEEIMTTAPRLL